MQNSYVGVCAAQLTPPTSGGPISCKKSCSDCLVPYERLEVFDKSLLQKIKGSKEERIVNN